MQWHWAAQDQRRVGPAQVMQNQALVLRGRMCRAVRNTTTHGGTLTLPTPLPSARAPKRSARPGPHLDAPLHHRSLVRRSSRLALHGRRCLHNRKGHVLGNLREACGGGTPPCNIESLHGRGPAVARTRGMHGQCRKARRRQGAPGGPTHDAGGSLSRGSLAGRRLLARPHLSSDGGVAAGGDVEVERHVKPLLQEIRSLAEQLPAGQRGRARRL